MSDRELPHVLRGSETVLLVEDDEDIRRLVTTSLRRLGYAVLVAGTAEEALSMHGGGCNPVSLLFTDIILPSMDGGTLAASLRAQIPGLLVLYASGYPSANLTLSLDPPRTEFIQKPYTVTNLVQQMRVMLDSRVA